MSKCVECTSFKKADNCQACYIRLKASVRDKVRIDVLELLALAKVYHMTSLDKITAKLDFMLENLNYYVNVEQ